MGERVEMRRRMRGLPRNVVAQLVGRSEEWLRLIESGQRRLNDIAAIVKLAEVLRVHDIGELIDWPAPPLQPPARTPVLLLAPLRQALIADLAEAHPPGRIQPMDVLAVQVAECRRIWQESTTRYSTLSKMLPPLLIGLRAHTETPDRAQAEGADAAECDELLRQTYLSARQLLTRLGAHDLAWLAADRAVEGTRRDRTAITSAVGRWHLSTAFLHMPYPGDCHDYALAAARSTEDAADNTDRAVLVGALQLVAAQAADLSDDLPETSRLLGLARTVAEQLGGDHSVDGIVFGPTRIGMVAIEIALNRNNFDQALQIAADLEVPDTYPTGQLARHHIALARAYLHTGERVGAVFALGKAAEASPEDLRYDLDAHHTLQQLILTGNRVIGRDVIHLAELAGLV
ncbi:helix-turn-helix domain-containing protein [Nocardia terpenica]|uniref:helix-turn-helix domain-containing protein n=1 Tax=Nocardia terpenica TaxID=455432 RepID=UPI0015C53343|nr:helix-turn-helix domain-containing protein [Nocardia terpenica]NQE93396.1 helix-turn-helix domain-containing protein [Nocardia terpenica]